MIRSVGAAALLLAMGAAMPARAGDAEDCPNKWNLDHLAVIEPNTASACRRLADQGNAAAQASLGLLYRNGKGVPRDDAVAEKWFRKAALQGDASGQLYLGLMYKMGVVVAQSDAEAVTWWRKAAEQGLAEAQYNLGFMYAKGQGIPQSDVEAVKWYRKAADQRYIDAFANLGSMYYKGRGVPQDNVQAYMWWRMLLTETFLREDTSQLRGALDEIAKRMTPAQIAEAERLAREKLKPQTTQ